MKVVTVVGARPQFIKAAAVSRAVNAREATQLREVLVHTGQHYDEMMSDVFFEELGIAPPAYNLGISGGSHGAMTGRMLEAIERVLIQEPPDWVLIYGDTNSTLAAALAAIKLHIPVAHVEAGLRSFNMRMPEEINRIVADRLASLLFCPTTTAVENLEREGITKGVHLVGDVMYDVALHFAALAAARESVLGELGVTPKRYVLATCHRAENTDSPEKLRGIAAGLGILARSRAVVFPVHPRTKAKIVEYGCAPLLARGNRHRSCFISRHGGSGKECGNHCHRLRRCTEGSLLLPGALRYGPRRDRVGGDCHNRLERFGRQRAGRHRSRG